MIRSATNSGGQIDTIKGYSIKLVEINDGVNKVYSKAVEVTDLGLNEVTIYPSVSSAAESLGISSDSISTYISRKRSTPYRKKYLLKFI